MFGFSLTAWLVAAGIAATALVGSHWRVYLNGKEAVRKEWRAADAERAAAQATADESERLKGHAAALSYEQARAERQVQIVYRDREVNRAIEADAPWASVALPPGVRDAIAAAVGQAAPASGADAALRLPAAGGVDERPVGPGLRFGPGRAGGLLGAASSPR